MELTLESLFPPKISLMSDTLHDLITLEQNKLDKAKNDLIQGCLDEK